MLPSQPTIPVKKKSPLKIVGIVLAVFFALGIIGSITGKDDSTSVQEPLSTQSASKSESTPPEETPIIVDASDLLQAYKDNELAADKEYKDQLIQVTGTVGNVGKDILDDAYIIVDSGDSYEFYSIQCYLMNNDEIDKAASLKSGDTITVQGTCSGYSLNVILKKAKIIE